MNSLVEYHVNQEEANYDHPDENILLVEDETWTMYFDGASNHKGYRVGI